MPALLYSVPLPRSGPCRHTPLLKTPGRSQASLAQSLVGSPLLSFVTMQELLLYNHSPVCGSSPRWFYGGVMAISSKRTSATCSASQVFCSQSPGPHQATADPCIRRRRSKQKGRSGSVSSGSLGPGAHKILFEPSKHLWWVWGLILCFSPSYHLVGLLLWPWTWGIFFLGGSNILLLMVV